MKIKQVLLLALLVLCSLPAHAQGTAFTYQGHLSASGAPASGNYDLTFALFNNNSTNTGQVGNPLTNLDVGVTNGLFIVTLNFGAGIFTGSNYWLETGVRTNGGASFTALNPLQELTPTPYAIYAPSAGSAASANSVAATNITGAIPLAQLPAAVVTNAETNVTLNGTFNGNGGGLTNNSTSSLMGGVASQALDIYGQTQQNFYPQSAFRWVDSFYANYGGSSNSTTGSSGTGFVYENWVTYQMTNLMGNGYPLFRAGWNTILLEDGWWYGRNTTTGFLEDNTNNFPDGVPAVIAMLHAHGMKVVLYYDDKVTNGVSPVIQTFVPDPTSEEGYSGGITWQMYSNDCVTFRNWGIDGLMWDNRGGGYGSDSSPPYSDSVTREHDEQWSYWMKTINPNIPFITYGSSLTNYDWVFVTPSNFDDMSFDGGSEPVYDAPTRLPAWRPNCCDIFAYETEEWGCTNQMQVLAQQINWTYAASQYINPSRLTFMGTEWAEGEYRWDINNGGGPYQAAWGKTSMTFWSLFHSPLSLSYGFGYFSSPLGVPTGWFFLTNQTCLNIQRDPYCNIPIQQTNTGTGGTVWTEYLANGSYAIAFLNVSNAQSQTLTANFAWLGIASDTPMNISNVWYATNVTVSNSFTINYTNYNCDLFILSSPVNLNPANLSAGTAAINISGNAATATTAANVTGNIADSQLSPNVALLSANQTFQGQNVFITNVGIGNSNPTNKLMVVNARCDGSSWINASDRNLKQDFAAVDAQAVLEKVAALPVRTWSYKAQPEQKHLGPVAQDFHAAFGLGMDDVSISTVDESGVALAAIQGLNQKLNEKDVEIQELKQSVDELKKLVQSLAEKK
jgi:hypothetical protein